MKESLKKTVLDSRQFVGVLLVGFSVASLVIAFIVASQPSDSREAMAARWQAEFNMVETFGFLLPPLQSLIVPLLGATALLAAVNLWLSMRMRLGASNG